MVRHLRVGDQSLQNVTVRIGEQRFRIAHFHNAPSGPGAVTLAFPATATKMTISQKMSADGGRYAAGRVEFWIKGQQASFTQGDHKTTCKVSK